MKLNIDDEQGIELLHWIFEREFKPPFKKGNRGGKNHTYYNRNGEFIGHLGPLGTDKEFVVAHDPYYLNIRDKVQQAFDFPKNTRDWWFVLKPILISWMENQINVKLKNICW